MVDAGFLQAAYHDSAGNRILLILAADHISDVERRLAHLPIVSDGSVTFKCSQVTALRFT
jgi:hypothetical protein